MNPADAIAILQSALLCAALLLCGCSTIRDAVDEYRDCNRHLWVWESFAQGSREMAFSKFVYNTNVGSTYPVVSVDDKVLLTVSYRDRVANTFVGTDPDASVVIASNQIVGDQPIYIGKIPGYNTYGGKIYCVRLYNRALTQSEIAHNYEVDKARFGL